MTDITTLADRLAAAEAAVPSWSYGMSMERDGARWLLTDPFKGLQRFAIAWYQDGVPPVTAYTRDQYEAACVAAGIDTAADSELGTYADKHASPYPGEWPDDAQLALTLRRRRMQGIERETPPAPPVVRLAPPEPVPTHCMFCGLPLSRSGDCEECV